MSINMTNVKSITLGGVSVKKIEDANGNVLWEEVQAVVLDHIAISGSYKTKIPTGDSFVFGGTVRAYYTDGTNAYVTSSATFSGYNMSTAGTYTVTVSYTEDGVTKTTSYSLQVANATTASLSVSVGISYGITTTQYSNRLVFPSKNTAISYIANNQSRDVYDITGAAITQLYFYKASANTYYTYVFLMSSNSTTSTIIKNFGSFTGNYAVVSIYLRTPWDMYDLLNASTTKTVYGAYAQIQSGGTTPTAPTNMFSTSQSSGIRWCSVSSATVAPLYNINYTYRYFA